MSSFEIGILIFITYLCLYSIVNRICKAVEVKTALNHMQSVDLHHLEKELEVLKNAGKGKE